MNFSRRRMAYVSVGVHCAAFLVWLRLMGGTVRPSALLWVMAVVGQFTWSATLGLMYAGRRNRASNLWLCPVPVLVAFYCVPVTQNSTGRSVAEMLVILVGVGVLGVLAGRRLSASLRAARSANLRLRGQQLESEPPARNDVPMSVGG